MPEAPKDNSQDTKKVVVIIVISILLGVNGLLLWQFFDKKTHLQQVSRELDTTMAEKESLSAELQRVKNDYEKLNQENASLQTQLSARDEEIRLKIIQIQKLIQAGDAAQLKKAREELLSLRSLNAAYVAQIDSLRSANAALSTENLSLNENLNSATSKVNALSQENSVLSNKVAIASVFKTGNLRVSGVKYKGSGKETEVNRAKVTERIKTCFTILENLVVDKGPRDVYMRLLGPDGAVLTTSSETFPFKGQATPFTLRETIMYENRDTDLCMYFERGKEYPAGRYQIELYCEGSMIGSTVLTLK
jgi:hypothetical protein